MGWRSLRNLSAAVFACLAIGACESADRHPAKPITKLEARNLPPDVVARRVANQLADVLQLAPYPRGGRPRFVLDDLWFSTKPRSTHVAGVCQLDVVVFEFEAAEGGSDSATPTRVKGVTANSEFYLLGHPAMASEAARAHGRCDRLDPQQVSFFQAEGPEIALEAMLLLESLQTQIKSGTTTAEIVCHGGPKDECARYIANVGLSEVRAITSCGRGGDAGKCLSFEAGSAAIDVYASFAGSIWKASFEERVILSHPRLD